MMAILWDLLARIIHFESSTVVIAGTAGRKHTIQGGMLIAWVVLAFVVLKRDLEKREFLCLWLFALRQKYLELQRLGRLALKWGIKHLVESVEALLTLGHWNPCYWVQCLLVPLCLYFARLSCSSHNCHSYRIDAELFGQHEVLLQRLKGKVIDVPLDFLQSLLVRLLVALTWHWILLSELVIRKYDTLEQVAVDEVQWGQCIEIPVENVQQPQLTVFNLAEAQVLPHLFRRGLLWQALPYDSMWSLELLYQGDVVINLIKLRSKE